MDIFKKYLNEDDIDLGGPMGGSGLGQSSSGLGGGPMGSSNSKSLDSIPGDRREKAIAAASAAVDNLEKQLIGLDELDTLQPRIKKLCANFKNALKSQIIDGMQPANRPWSDDNGRGL